MVESEIKHNMLEAPLLNWHKTYKTKYGLLHKNNNLSLTYASSATNEQKVTYPKMWPAAWNTQSNINYANSTTDKQNVTYTN